MDYAQHFSNVLKSDEFVGFKNEWSNTYGVDAKSVRRHANKDGILVVGAGVTGLTTAVRLSLQGYNVKIIAKEFIPKDTMAPGYVSTVAGALWEYPPAVCGRHRNEVSIARSKVWAIETYKFLKSLSKLPGDHGVGMKNTIFYMRYLIDGRSDELEKMEAYAKYCDGFERGLHLVDRTVVQEKSANKIKDCYQVQCPVIDTSKYLLWLHLVALALGVHFHEGVIPAPLHKYEAKICKQFGVRIIVNCSGMGSIELVPDPDVYPLRGALVRVWNDGRDFPVVTSAHAIGHDQLNVDENGKSLQDIVFLVPRGKVLLLGGIAEEDKWNIKENLITYQPYRDMLHRCQKFMPCLKSATVIEEEPVRVGLRPAHTTGVKNYLEKGTCIIHNYGHGGSGFSFSLGSADDVIKMAAKLYESTNSGSRIVTPLKSSL